MNREPTEAERLFDVLTKIAEDAGFSLHLVRMTGRPAFSGVTQAAFSEYTLRSHDGQSKLLSHSVIENLFGG